MDPIVRNRCPRRFTGASQVNDRCSRSPVVIALAGLPGAGKSTLARALCERFALSLVDRDALRAAMFPDCRYTEDEKLAAQQAVKEAVKKNCAANGNSLIDGMTFARRSVRHEFRKHASACGARFVLVWLDCPAAVARDRVASDNTHAAGDRVPGLVDRIAGKFEEPVTAAGRIDGTLTPQLVLQRASEIVTSELKLEEKA